MGKKRSFKHANDRLTSLEQAFILCKATKDAQIEEQKEQLARMERLYCQEVRKSRQLQEVLDQHKKNALELADDMRQKLTFVAQRKEEDLQKIDELEQQIRKLQQEVFEKDKMLQESRTAHDVTLDRKIKELENNLTEKNELYLKEERKLKQFWSVFEQHRQSTMEVVSSIREKSVKLFEENRKKSEKIKELQKELAQKNEFCVKEANKMKVFSEMFEDHKKSVSKFMRFVKQKHAKDTEEKRANSEKVVELRKKVRELQEKLIEKDQISEDLQSDHDDECRSPKCDDTR